MRQNRCLKLLVQMYIILLNCCQSHIIMIPITTRLMNKVTDQMRWDDKLGLSVAIRFWWMYDKKGTCKYRQSNLIFFRRERQIASHKMKVPHHMRSVERGISIMKASLILMVIVIWAIQFLLGNSAKNFTRKYQTLRRRRQSS